MPENTVKPPAVTIDQQRLNTHSRIVDAGENEMTSIAACLINASQWFMVTPLPGDEYEVTVKVDYANQLDVLVGRP